jgi:hypothetical protein
MKKKIFLISGSICVVLIAFFGLVIPQLSLGLNVGYNVAVKADYAYISGNEGVDIFNVADPRNPTRIADVNSPDGAFDIEIHDNHLYIASDSDGFEIVDISDPENTLKLGEFNDGGSIVDVDVEGNLAYCLERSSGIKILNITEPSEIVHISTYYDIGDCRSFQIYQDVGYLADPSVGLKVLNLTDPYSITKIRTVSGTYGNIDSHICDNILFLACHAYGVKILNISNPTIPVSLGSFYKANGEAYGVAGNRTHLYVADLQLGVYLLNITDLSNPVELVHNENGHPHDISFDGEFVYLADQDRKLIILSSELITLFSGNIVGSDEFFSFIIGVTMLAIFTRKNRR